jgi:hypothetical protein
VAVVIMVTRDPHAEAGTPTSAIVSQVDSELVRFHLLSFVAYWVLAMPLGVAYWLTRPSTWWAEYALVARTNGKLRVALRASLISLVMLTAGLGASVGQWRVAAVVLGAAAFSFVTIPLLTSLRPLQLALGLWLLVPIPVVLYVNYSSKYLILCAPAVAILVVRWMRDCNTAIRTALGTAIVLASMALATAIIRVDSRIADLDRRAAEELIAPEVRAGRAVWYVGRWALHWYAEQAGAKPVTVNGPLPAAGDLVVRSFSNSSQALRLITHRQLVAWHWQDTTSNLWIMSRQANAGFYSDRFGPFLIGRAREDSSGIQVWRVAADTGPRLTLKDLTPKARWR